MPTLKQTANKLLSGIAASGSGSSCNMPKSAAGSEYEEEDGFNEEFAMVLHSLASEIIGVLEPADRYTIRREHYRLDRSVTIDVNEIRSHIIIRHDWDAKSDVISVRFTHLHYSDDGEGNVPMGRPKRFVDPQQWDLCDPNFISDIVERIKIAKEIHPDELLKDHINSEFTKQTN